MKIHIQLYPHGSPESYDLEGYASVWDEDRLETEGQIERISETISLQNRKLGRLLSLLADKSTIDAPEIVQVIQGKTPHSANISK